MLRVDEEEESILREKERERRERKVSKPLVHSITKDREGAGNPEITKVENRNSCTGEIYTHRRGHVILSPSNGEIRA